MTLDINAIKARLARVAGKWPTTGVMAPGADEFGPKAWSAHGPLRCHATETGSARSWAQANADADFIAAAPADIAALVAEVSLLQQEARIQQGISDGLAAEVEHLREHRESCTENLLKGYETGKTEERAAVVAWLREVADAPETYVDEAIALRGASASIERGEHRREEGA